MQIYNGVTELKKVIPKSVVTIGNFDGLHLGHHEIITRLVHRAHELRAPAVLMTFYPHPRKILYPEKGIKNIFSKEDLELELEKMGVDIVIFEPFSREFSQMSAKDFIQQKIYKPLAPQSLIVGYDFAFGANRSGSLENLKSLADNLKFDLEIVSPIKNGQILISSTHIRLGIEQGDMELVEKMLGRPFYLKGIVEKGEGRGKKLGFATANLATLTEIYPRNGVYATKTLVRGSEWLSVTNVGKNPTFNAGASIKVETHILNFKEDIYGEEIVVKFKKYIRDEIKFSDINELIKQIRLDVEFVKGLNF